MELGDATEIPRIMHLAVCQWELWRPSAPGIRKWATPHRCTCSAASGTARDALSSGYSARADVALASGDDLFVKGHPAAEPTLCFVARECPSMAV